MILFSIFQKCYNINITIGGNMKTVVITGSARGLGFEMAKLFRKANLNVVISDLKEENLIKAKE
jgi:NAD(P)-dependent dehydrogenase (short-subunit alcohol dehydrogenase family)